MTRRRVIRRLPPHRIADFDDYLWSVNVALLVFGACVAGVIVFESDFRTSQLFYNGWVRLGTLMSVMGLLVWGMTRLDSYWSRRMQLSALLALITHLWVGVFLHEQRLELTMLPEAAPSFGEEESPLVTLPDYDFQTIEQTIPDETIDDPTAIEAPDATLPEPPAREAPLPQTAPERTIDVAEPIELDGSDSTPLTRAEVAAPRRNELASLGNLSRQERSFETAIELIDAPPLAIENAATESPLAPQEIAPARQATTPERVSRLPSTEGAGDWRPALSGITRRESNSAPEGASPAAPRSRELASIERPSSERIALGSLPGREASQATNLQPRVDIVARGAGGGPLQPASGPGATPAGGTAPGLRDGLTADFGGLMRSRDPRGGGHAAGPPSQDASAGGGGAPLARTATGGSVNLDDSATMVTAAPRGAGGGAATALEPMNTGVTRGSGGLTGRTRQGNFDLELPGGGINRDVASAAARRANATDEMTGTDQFPSRPAQFARARAGSEIPSGAFSDADVPLADVGAVGRPGEIQASSSATVERRSTAAPRGPVTGSVGSSAVDLGSGRPGVSPGSGRSAGGGEPTVSSSYSAGSLTRGTPGAAIGSAASIDVDQIGLGAETGTGAGAGGGPGGQGSGGLGPSGPGGGGVARSGSGGLPARRGNGGGVPGIEPGLGGIGGTSAELSRAAGNGQPGPSLGAGTGTGSGSGTGTGLGSGRTLASAPSGTVVADDPLAGSGAGGGAGSVGNGSGQTGGSDAAGPGGDGVGELRRSAAAGGTAGTRPGGGGSAVGIGVGGGNVGSGAGSGLSRRSSNDGPAVSAGVDGIPGGRRTAVAAFDDDSAEIGPVAAAGTAFDGGGNGAVGAASGPIGPANGNTDVTRQQSTVVARTPAPVGAGGFGNGPAVSPGIPDRRARPESDVVNTSPQRFVLDRAGGASASIDAKADTGPVQGLRQRNPSRRGGIAEAMGGNDASERAVEMGLDFLARHQLEDGRWSLHDLAGGKAGYQNTGAGSMKTDTAATGLALLAFYGAGYTHSDGKYRLVVRRGLDQLLSNQEANGCLFIPQDVESAKNVRFYSHGIGAIVLCEAYGMTRDKDLREPAQQALNYIVASQHPSEGGWRYSPGGGSDTSVSGWQMMAMKSGELAGLKVPPQTYDRLRDWLEHAATPWGSPARYAYRPRSTDQNQAKPSLAMTAEGLLMQQYLGWQRDNPYLRDGAEYLKANLPRLGTPTLRTRDCYYWYYATQVMFQMQGEYWTSWNEALRPLLIDNQVQEGQFAGSWEPTGPTPDRWGPHGGRLYVTCMHLLMLEVYYRHLPLYRDLNVAQAQP